MKKEYIYNGAIYGIEYNETDQNHIIFTRQPAKSTLIRIEKVRVYNSKEYTLKINKKSISALNGAAGLYNFICDCIDTEIMFDTVHELIYGYVKVI